MNQISTLKEFFKLLRKATGKTNKKGKRIYQMQWMHTGQLVGEGKDRHYGNHPIFWPGRGMGGPIFSPPQVVWFAFYRQSENDPYPCNSLLAFERIGLSKKKWNIYHAAAGEADGHDPKVRERIIKACRLKEVKRKYWTFPHQAKVTPPFKKGKK